MQTAMPQTRDPAAPIFRAALIVTAILILGLDPARAAAGVEFDRMAFFEAGDGAGERPPQDWDDPRYRDRFPRDETRYIFTMVSLKNMRWELEDQHVSLQLRYYRSDGRLFGDPMIDYAVPQDWEYAELWNGWGWPEPGAWEPDRYRVELWLDSRKRIGAGYFTIH